jgi:hypothetical protein
MDAKDPGQAAIADSPAPPEAQRAANSGGRRVREFIEMCGRHPFATGLFALLSVVGLFFSFVGFGVDQVRSQRDALDSAAMQSSLERIEDSVDTMAPAAEPAGFDPVESTPLDLATITDNAIFPRRYMGKPRDWIQANVDESFASIPFLSFSLKSVAGEDFVQLAPYLVVDVAAVAPVPPSLAVIYEGERGGASELWEFSAAIVPEVGFQFAPLINDDQTFRTDVDYFSLMPREPAEFVLGMSFVPGYVYTLRIGVPYKYKGRHQLHWLSGTLRAGVPVDPLPVAGFDGSFEIASHPDFEPRDYDAVATDARKNLRAISASKLFPPSQVGKR